MSPPKPRVAEHWETLLPGLRKKVSPAGPWFQYRDVVGFEWNTYEVQLENLPAALKGTRILQISDLHCEQHWQTAYDDLIDRIQADEPDLILLTGDIIDLIYRPGLCLPTARRVLSGLRAPGGVLAIRGNHDLFMEPANLTCTPVRFIDGQRLLVDIRGEKLELIGVPGPERHDCPPGFEKTFPAKTPGVPRIIASHFPDHFRKLKLADPDIFLAGHTHGGQACLPGRIPILRHDSLPLDQFQGVHRLGKTWFFVSRGFGFSTFPFRVFCPAEVIEIRLSST